MLQIKEVEKNYRSKLGVNVKALDRISIDFAEKGLIFITGKSGCGKSTLLNILGGLDTPDRGELIINGRSSETFLSSDFDSYRNTYCGFVFQEYNLIDDKTVGENIGLALELQGEKADKERIEKLLKNLGLIDSNTGKTLFGRFVNELSGGQKQRVTIARALIKNPEIILADEPTGALDSESGIQLYELLKQLAQNKLIVVVSHDRENAEKYGDRIIELKDGHIISDTTAKTDVKISSENNEQCVFIRSKLPCKRVFAMGASSLIVKKFRLVLSMILTIITFVIFGFSLTAAFANPLAAELGQMYQSGQELAVLYNTETWVDDEGVERISTRKFTDAQMREIIGFNGGILPPLAYDGPYDTFYGTISVNMNYHVGVKDNLNLSWAYGNYISAACSNNGLVEINKEVDETVAKLRPDERLIDKTKNRLPETFYEIAITDMHADLFMRFGYVESRTYDENGNCEISEVIPINTPDDLIGKTLGVWQDGRWRGYPFTIVGVFSTEQNRSRIVETLDNFDHNLSDYAKGVKSGIPFSMISHVFVKEGLLDFALENGLAGSQAPYNLRSSFLIRLSGDMAKDTAFFHRLNVTEDGHKYIAEIATPFSGFVGTTVMYFTWIVPIGLIATAVFAVFAVLLMMNFLTVSIDAKKREIGILRALGARKSDIAQVCLVESLLMTIVELVLAAVIIAILCAVLNGSFFFLQVLQFGIVQIALLTLLCLTVSVLATIIPVMKITKKKPIDIINHK